MAGFSENEPYILRLNIPFDLQREEDARFVEQLDKLPNGTKVSVVRYLMTRALPVDAEAVKKVFDEALSDYQGRGRFRGRPRNSSATHTAKKAAKEISTAKDLKTVASEVCVTREVRPPTQPVQVEVQAVQEQKVVTQEQKVVTQEKTVAAQRNTPTLADFSGLLGTTNWN